MLNPEVKLNKKLFDKNSEQKATRDGFGDGLVAAAEIDLSVVALCADVTESTRNEEFAKKFPERFFEMGVAEQNMAAIAAGLGVSGKIPYISSYAVFSPGRNWEQIRTTIAYNDSNVKIAGHHAGISTGPDGATHQATEDIAIMRAMPNMKVFVPCDAIEAKKATMAAAKIWGPVYMRFQREKSPIFTTEETPFKPGNAEIFWQSRSPQVLIIGCGPILYNAIVAAKELDNDGIGSIVLNCHTIKPLDEDKIVELAKKCGTVVTVEEHQIAGGLGGAVAEALAKHYPAPMEFVGIKDVFGESGTAKELMDKFNLEAKDIKAAAKRVIKRK
ncbi:MAG: transketolase C-terminal domain-containing protein [Candidatus Pacebacteria bacterium]|nr:transketolase C-terminal domain-containing protein [Candidatus Paceibacterota bacterium]